MSRGIFFCRHGYQLNDSVTEKGYDELRAIRYRLHESRFRPGACFSSSEVRSIQTAHFLSYGLSPTVVPELHAYGNLHEVGIVTATGPRWIGAREYATETLRRILETAPSCDLPLTVVTHDYAPLLLARKYLELHGVSVNWKEREGSFPLQGEGVLVEGSRYELFRHQKAEVVE